MNIVYIEKPFYLQDWVKAELSTLGNLVIYYDRPGEAEIIHRLSECDIAIIETVTINKSIFRQPGKLKTLIVAGTGFEFVDVESALSSGIVVCNIPDYSTHAVTEYIIGVFIWMARKAFLKESPIMERTELFGKTLGIIGLGTIGTALAKLGQALGMNVVGFNRSPKNIAGVINVSLDELLLSSQFIAVCLSSNASNHNLLDDEKLRLIQGGAVLVNIASNAVLDESTVIKLLEMGQLSGASFEEFSNKSIHQYKNVLVTNGMAWCTDASLERNSKLLVQTVEAAIRQRPIHVVSS